MREVVAVDGAERVRAGRVDRDAERPSPVVEPVQVPVVEGAQGDEVGALGRTAVGPVQHVVDVEVASADTAGEAAATGIAEQHAAPERRVQGASTTADVDGSACPSSCCPSSCCPSSRARMASASSSDARPWPNTWEEGRGEAVGSLTKSAATKGGDEGTPDENDARAPARGRVVPRPSSPRPSSRRPSARAGPTTARRGRAAGRWPWRAGARCSRARRANGGSPRRRGLRGASPARAAAVPTPARSASRSTAVSATGLRCLAVGGEQRPVVGSAQIVEPLAVGDGQHRGSIRAEADVVGRDDPTRQLESTRAVDQERPGVGQGPARCRDGPPHLRQLAVVPALLVDAVHVRPLATRPRPRR